MEASENAVCREEAVLFPIRLKSSPCGCFGGSVNRLGRLDLVNFSCPDSEERGIDFMLFRVNEKYDKNLVLAKQ
ncbi:hypothetical protein KIN20_030982 [Parelaphostrongylus tenuis]|uniref:Uncharacterized protein n=1 Tax=Parelaphostrongylus tenuis TaxID=148309 RepID=A0AAD5R4V2_PARTN|nr:hypothetical protein KIN20_030982 [Parelaphostrongylus tenuis]